MSNKELLKVQARAWAMAKDAASGQASHIEAMKIVLMVELILELRNICESLPTAGKGV